ncbi:MAG: hypothetical protein ACRCWI_02740 [Brevinema sp.]
MFKKIQLILAIMIIISAGVFLVGVIGYLLWYHNQLQSAIQVVLFLMVVIHYVCSMGNQSLFYGYFQSWEWKPLWENNNLRRIAGEHKNIIKRALINCMIVIPLVIGAVYSLYHYKLLKFYPFDEIVWFSYTRLYAYILNAWVLPVYWYMILGFSLLFFSIGFIFNFSKQKFKKRKYLYFIRSNYTNLSKRIS